MSPVTVTAEVAVNRASMNEIGFVVENGRNNNNVPMPMRARKLIIMIYLGDLNRIRAYKIAIEICAMIFYRDL